MASDSSFELALKYAGESGRYSAELKTIVEWYKGSKHDCDAVAQVYRNLLATKIEELDNEFNAERV